MPLVYYSKVTGIAELIGVQLCKQHWLLTPGAAGSIAAASKAGETGISKRKSCGHILHPDLGKTGLQLFCLTVLGMNFQGYVDTPVLW